MKLVLISTVLLSAFLTVSLVSAKSRTYSERIRTNAYFQALNDQDKNLLIKCEEKLENLFEDVKKARNRTMRIEIEVRALSQVEPYKDFTISELTAEEKASCLILLLDEHNRKVQKKNTNTKDDLDASYKSITGDEGGLWNKIKSWWNSFSGK